MISNTKLLEQELHNMARLDRRRALTTFGVGLPDRARAAGHIQAELKAIVEREKPGPSITAPTPSASGPSSIDFELVFHVESAADEGFHGRAPGDLLDMAAPLRRARAF